MSAEDFVLAGLMPEPGLFPNARVDQASVIEPSLTTPCPEHSLAGCQVCGERIRRAQEVSAARLKPAESGIVVATPPRPDIEEPDVVRLAERFAQCEEQLSRERQQLTAAESRVEFLQASIASSEVAVQGARQQLLDHLHTMDQNREL